jgi:hypothetical protein
VQRRRHSRRRPSCGARRFLRIARDLARRGPLLLDSGRDRGGDRTHFSDRAANALDRIDRAAGHVLDRGDLRRDLLGRFGGLIRQGFHFRCDDREALAGLASGRWPNGKTGNTDDGL